MPKVSIVVPIYNVEKYLGECLESLLKQTLREIEIICINDGSTDNSLQILQEFATKDERIIVIDKKNEGYGKTVNRGLDIATGEYVAILESDDFVKPDMYETLYHIAKSNDNEVLKCDFYNYFGATGQTTQVDQYPAEILDKNIVGLENKVIFKLQPAIWSALYKREFLNKNNIRFFPTQGASYQDIGFAFKCYYFAKNLRFTNQAFLFYRQDNMGSSVNNKEKVYCIKDEIDLLDKFIEEQNETTNLSDLIAYLKLSYYSWNLKRIAPEFQKEFVEFISKELAKIELSSNCEELFSKKQILEYNLIVENPQKYLSKIQRKLFFRKISSYRKKLISIRKSNSKLQVSILGKSLIS